VWREVVTNAYGASSVLGRWAFPLWVVGLGVFSASVFGIADTWTLYEVTGFLLGAVVCLFMASETIASERRGRTLELVTQSTMHSLSLVAGKVVAVALVGGPYLAVAASATIGNLLLKDGYWIDDPGMQYTRAWCGHWSIGCGDRLLKGAVTLLWFPVVWATLVQATMLAALWVRQPRQAAVAALLIVTAFLAFPALVGELIDDPLGDRLSTLAWPFTAYWGDVTCGTSPWMFASVLVYSLAACGLFLACTGSIRLVVRRDAR
jgi:ABC-type Na+ efflux pump permease subunit